MEINQYFDMTNYLKQNKSVITWTLNSILLTVISLYSMIGLYALVDYFVYAEWYRFGSEVEGWRYQTEYHFLGMLMAEIFLAFFGIVAGFIFKKEPIVILFRFAIVTLLGAMIISSLTV